MPLTALADDRDEDGENGGKQKAAEWYLQRQLDFLTRIGRGDRSPLL
jgi:hypothetical protein